ncbi:MAG: hypothetical protein GY793_08320 [Proteobacteria bacterium]|nr:hypothetical protein [Pseudomonadota bacterium]
MNNEWKELRLENLHEILGGGKDVRLKGCTATIILSIRNLTLMCSGMSNGVFNYEYRPKPKAHDDLAEEYFKNKFKDEGDGIYSFREYVAGSIYRYTFPETIKAVFIAGRKSMEE